MKRAIKKTLTVLVALVLLFGVGIVIALLTFDANTYRPQLVELLGKQTGRTVKLDGPIKLNLSMHGASLIIENAAIGNPSWASRPEMAGIGHFELGIALLPLLSHQLSITELKIANADIQLETGEGDKHNWDMAFTQQGKANTKTTTSSTGKSIAIQADHVFISDSQLSIRDKEGKVSVFKTKLLTYGIEGGGIAIHFNGEYNNAPLALALKTSTNDLLANVAWPFNIELTYADYQIKAQGKANLASKMASLSDYVVAAGQSEIHGQMSINLAGARPALKGTLVSNQLDPADFKSTSQPNEADENGSPTSSEPNHVFSNAPLPFDMLKSVDADIEVNIASLTVGGAVLNSLSSKIDLNNGHFSAPLKAGLGKSLIGGTIKIDADSKPPQIAAAFSGPSIDLADLLAIAHAPAFLSGNANAEMDVTTSGYSMHNLAGDANGKLDIIAAGGDISSNQASGISSALMQMFAPKGNNALNCLAARFTITNGVVRDNGILVDSAATTVAGKGGFNLGLETIDMLLHAKPKIANIGGVLPPLQINGTFTSPHFNIDSAALVQNVAGILTSGSLDSVASNSNVPNVTGPAGVNACVYTLDHPTAVTNTPAASSVLVPGVNGQIQKLKEAAPGLLKGLLGQ